MTAYSENAYERTLQVLGRLDHAELVDTYKRFVTRLQSILTPEEQVTYASFQQRTTGGVQPEEQEVADKVAADAEAGPLFEQYLSALRDARPPEPAAQARKRGR